MQVGELRDLVGWLLTAILFSLFQVSFMYQVVISKFSFRTMVGNHQLVYIFLNRHQRLSTLIGSECHRINSEADIHTMLIPVIADHQWQSICTNLGVDTKLLSDLQLSYVDNSIKMETCLNSFAVKESACWETVVLAVCELPLNHKEVAKKIADKYSVSWAPFETLCGSKLK